MISPIPLRMAVAALAASIAAAVMPLAPVAASGTFPVQVGTISNLGWVPRDYAASPDGAWVYGAGGRQVHWIRASDSTVTRSQTYSGPFDMETIGVSADGARLYLPLPDHSVRVVNTADGTVARTITLPLGCSPGRPVAAPAGGRVYVPCTGTGGIRVIDESNWTNTAINAVTGTIRIVITPDSSRLYALSGSNVIVIDTTSGTASATIATGAGSLVRLAISPDGSRVYAGSHTTRTVVAIATATNTVIASAVLPDSPMELTATNDAVYATQLSNSVYVSDAALAPIGAAPASDRTSALSPVVQGRFYTTAWADIAVFDLSGTPPGGGASSAGTDEGTLPTAPQQAFAVPAGTVSSDCAAREPADVAWPGLAGLEGHGWAVGYAEWPNGGTGGWVCYRQPVFDGSRWTIA